MSASTPNDYKLVLLRCQFSFYCHHISTWRLGAKGTFLPSKNYLLLIYVRGSPNVKWTASTKSKMKKDLQIYDHFKI
jgi:hypothetical protein